MTTAAPNLGSALLAAALLFGTAAGSAVCQQYLSRPAHHVVQVGVYPHCRFGVAHGSRGPQCSMPQLAPNHGPLHLAWQSR